MSEDQSEYKTQTAVQQKLAAMFAANKDDVSVPKIYIDMTGDWKAAAVLDELMFWTLPKKGTGKTSLRVFRNGALWLAVRRSDWWDRKRLTERQADTAIDKLVSLGLVEKDVFLFDGKPTVHIRMIMTEFVRLYTSKINDMAQLEDDENMVRDIADLYEMMGFPNENVISNLQNGEMLNLQNGEMLNLQNGEIINSPVQPPNTTKKGDLVDGMIFFGKQAKEQKIDKVEEFIQEVERGLKVNITRSNSNQAAARRIMNDGRPFGQWLTWCISDEWRAAHLYLYADLDKVWRDYPQAFDNQIGYNPQGLTVS